MEGGIGDAVLLDYIEFQIFPSQNRYESYVGLGNSSEMVKSATLEPLLLHLPAIRELYASGSDAKYKLIAPPASEGVRWFTKSTLVSFLNVVGLPEVVKATDATKNEISQLEEARKFHTSLYAKGQNKSDTGKTAKSSDGDAPISKAEISSTSPDDSKNELLRAIDLRLTALRGDLATAFAEAAGATFSIDRIDSLEKFSHHCGATDLRDSLCKLVELNQGKSPADFDSPNLATSTRENKISRNQETNLNSKPVQKNIPVKYNASPAKAAQLERESSSDNGEPSGSSEEEQQSVDRSRTLIRSASPRRSASPMRRVQIGRSGSRRSTALTIKSLNQIPRLSHRDAAGQSSDDEESLEQPPKKSESNVMRMSVQDAISLFENKQKDQVGNSQKASGVAVGANKSVLRRWSTGVGERSFQDPQGIVGENSDSMASNNTENDLKNESSEAKPERDLLSEGDQVLRTEAKSRPDSPEQRSSESYCIQENAAPSRSAETTEELVDSAEWSRQKEAELSQLLLKMMETKPAKYQNKAPDNKKRQSLPTEQKGGFYDQYKEKRNEKLRHESNGKLEEKKKQFRAMQQVLDQRKAEMSPANGSEARKRSVKAQKPQRTTLQPADQNKEISKSSVVKKASLKASSPLPATRKSWPSTPSPKPVGTSPAKTPTLVSSSGTAPVRKKLQPAVTRSSPKVEKPQWKSVKSKDTKQNDTKKSVENLNEKLQQLSKKPSKATKPKVQSANVESTISTKPSFYGRVTRKSSVVPVEPKPFLRKGSGMSSGVGPASRTKVSSQPEETLTPVRDLKHADESEMVSGTSGHVIELERNLEPLKDQVEIESSCLTVDQQPNEHVETSNEVSLHGDCSPSERALSMKDDVEESMISPTAWVEIEEDEEQPAPCGDNVFQNGSPQNATAVGMPSPRVRHSLSQMLLEESCEPDVIEWGNAENPPALVYQKEEPKGFKRLLKFARKSKTDANSSGWSTPSVFSEGEDDSEESKVGSKRIPENLLKKATLHAQNSAHGLSEKLPERQISASVNTKATRSFFSLSAFKGGKQNEGKFR